MWRGTECPTYTRRGNGDALFRTHTLSGPMGTNYGPFGSGRWHMLSSQSTLALGNLVIIFIICSLSKIMRGLSSAIAHSFFSVFSISKMVSKRLFARFLFNSIGTSRNVYGFFWNGIAWIFKSSRIQASWNFSFLVNNSNVLSYNTKSTVLNRVKLD